MEEKNPPAAKEGRAVRPTVVFLLWKNLNQISGVTSWVLALKPILQKAGYTVKIAVERPDPQDEKGVDYRVQDGEALVRALLECSPAILVAMNIPFHKPYANAVTEANNRGGRIHLLSVLHADTETEYYEPLEFFDRHTHSFLAVSQKIRSEVEKRLPWRTSTVEVMPCSVNCTSLARIAQHITGTPPLRLAYAGRLIQHQKRSLDLIPLVKELEKRKLDYRFSLIGDGPELVTLQKAFSNEMHRGKILFTGRLSPDRMEAIWKGNDIFVNVSAFEGTSVSMLEAMAAGCVPVVTRVSGVDDVIVAQKNGLHAPVGDMPSLAALIEGLDRNRESLAEMGKAAHQTITSQYSIHEYSRKFSALLDRLAATDPLLIPGHYRAKPEVLSNGDLAVRGNGPLTVYSIYTDEHRDMMNEWFLGTMRDDWSVHAHYAGNLGGVEASNCGSIPYYDLLKRRVRLVIQSLKDHWGQVILWIDTDVQFFARCSKIIVDTLKNHDIAFQSEWSALASRPHWQVCCGIMAMRCNEVVLQFWTRVSEMLSDPAEEFPHGDQSAVNKLLAERTIPIRATFFDARFWALSHGNLPLAEIVAHHANCTPPTSSKSSLELKLEQFKGVRTYLKTLNLTPFRVHFGPVLQMARRMGVTKIVCWPPGAGGREFVKIARQSGVEVTAFIDSNPDLHGTTIEGIKVLRPQQAAEAGSDFFVITTLLHDAAIADSIYESYSGTDRMPHILTPRNCDYKFENLVKLLEAGNIRSVPFRKAVYVRCHPSEMPDCWAGINERQGDASHA